MHPHYKHESTRYVSIYPRIVHVPAGEEDHVVIHTDSGQELASPHFTGPVGRVGIIRVLGEKDGGWLLDTQKHIHVRSTVRGW